MFSSPIYLLLTISIVTKYAECYVVLDNSASMRNVTKSQADDTQTAYSDSNNNGNNDVNDNHIRTSTINVTAIDNVMEMPKPNVAVDYSTFRANRDAIDALAEVETGELLLTTWRAIERERTKFTFSIQLWILFFHLIFFLLSIFFFIHSYWIGPYCLWMRISHMSQSSKSLR